MVELTQGYARPKKINRVSVTMFFLMCFMGYLSYCFWPLILLRANVMTAIEDMVIPAYKANLRPEEDKEAEFARLKTALMKQLTELEGMEDPEFEATFEGDEEEVRVTVEFWKDVHFAGTEKKWRVSLSPSQRTSAERVNW